MSTSVPPYKQYDANLSSNPGSGVAALVTFPATAGKYWLIDSMTFFMSAGGLAAVQFSTDVWIRDTNAAGTILWFSSMSVQNTSAFTLDRVVVGPGLGVYNPVLGNAVAIGFTGTIANLFERVTAGGYLV